jgi:hypothetical protein
MALRWMIPMLALLAACQAPSPTPSPAPKQDAPAPEQAAEKKPEPAPPPAVEGPEPTETVAAPTPKEMGPPPPWFSPDAFEHTVIVRQDLSGAAVPSGETSAMIVLELPAGTTPEQCIENFRKKLAETVSEPPTQAVMPQGHLSLRGKTDAYAYTVVCGLAKDKPTMFLSYIQ